MTTTGGAARPRSAGFTTIELMTVVVVIGTLASMTYPLFRKASNDTAVRSAKLEVVSYLSEARAAAIQNGKPVRFVRVGDAVKVLADSASTQVIFASSMDLYVQHKVRVTTTRDTIAFDPRGYGTGLSSMETIRLTRDAAVDSVCVSKFGKIVNGCAL